MTNNQERPQVNVETTAGLEMTTPIHVQSITEGNRKRVGNVP